ncbi:MAG: AMP-binding protein [Hyphomonadaceae bacterium]|nr:AMP-binding protein [Hyphomonadaceae bacterium]
MVLSYVSGASDHPLRYETIGQALEYASTLHADHEALVSRHQGVRMTFAELNQAADQAAAGLSTLGLDVGDRVGIWSPNNAEWVITQLATAKLGLVLVNINPAYRTAEIEYALNKVECRALILAEKFKTSDYISIIQELVPGISVGCEENLSSARLPHLKTAVVISRTKYDGFLRFQDVLDRATPELTAEVRKRASILQPEDPINIQFTSGTTGFPKGATLSHHNILNNAYFCGVRMEFTPESRLCIPVPLYHCFGMVLGVLTCVTHGATMVFPDEAFDPATVLQTVSEEKCTALHGVPTMFIAELDHPELESFDLSHLVTGVMAGSPCPIEVMKRVISDMNMSKITIGYGMTEVSPLSFQSLPDDTLEKRVGTVGRVHPFVESKIVDENGATVNRGQQGEILFRGYSVMRGYWNDVERTAEAIDGQNWMHSGDLGVMDEDGYVDVTGRLKDMIIRGGENIYPKEIEEYLYRHDSIQDVQVFGVPDDRFGEEVCAWIKLKQPGLTSEAVKAFCQGRIAHYKIPKYIVFVDEFPTTVTGKIQKFVMRKQMSQQLNC